LLENGETKTLRSGEISIKSRPSNARN
jgi:hypothetical protein